MTTTITPEQADTLPAEAIDLDALAELAKRLRREATAFDNDLGSDPEADAGTARLLREAAGAIDLARRTAVPSEQEPVAWRAPVNPHGQPGFEYAEAEQALIDKGRHERQPLFAHPAPAARVNEADWQPVAFAQTLELAIDRGMTGASDLSLEHLKDMFRRLYPNMSKAKVGRWLGWAQASVVAAGCGTLDEMKAINKRCSDAIFALDTGEPK